MRRLYRWTKRARIVPQVHRARLCVQCGIVADKHRRGPGFAEAFARRARESCSIARGGCTVPERSTEVRSQYREERANSGRSRHHRQLAACSATVVQDEYRRRQCAANPLSCCRRIGGQIEVLHQLDAYQSTDFICRRQMRASSQRDRT